MFDFNDSLKNNIQGNTFICAHRGSCGGNVPCNTLAAFNAALVNGAQMIELDVTKSRDGKHFVFHPGMEFPQLHSIIPISAMKASSVEKLRYTNSDHLPTQYKVEKLDEVLDFLKGKCYINVDKFWMDIPGISEVIRRVGVEKQVVVKAAIKDKYINSILECAKDFMFMPIVKNEDTITDMLTAKGINCIGAEVLFKTEDAKVCSDEYIEEMHKKGKILFANAEVYDYHAVLSAGHTDDISVAGEPDKGWGWLIDKGFDIIQTDFAGMLKDYITNRGVAYADIK